MKHLETEIKWKEIQTITILKMYGWDLPGTKNIFMNNIIKKFNEEGSPYFASSRLWDDGVIDPLETRNILGNSLSFCQNIVTDKENFGVFRA